jgi:hypothetical protein
MLAGFISNCALSALGLFQLPGIDLTFALEFYTDFGVLDSSRSDVAYEDWHGHKLDKKFFELISFTC